jgi:hypothetical protein
MESRSAWTDQRLDDRFDAIDRRFDQVDQRFDRVDQRFDRLESELRDMRLELRGEIGELRTLMIRFNGGMLLALFAAITAIFVRGG